MTLPKKSLQYILEVKVFLSRETNVSRYIALFVFGRSIKKFFPTDCVKIYLFPILIAIDFARWKGVGLPHIPYTVIR